MPARKRKEVVILWALPPHLCAAPHRLPEGTGGPHLVWGALGQHACHVLPPTAAPTGTSLNLPFQLFSLLGAEDQLDLLPICLLCMLRTGFLSHIILPDRWPWFCLASPTLLAKYCLWGSVCLTGLLHSPFRISTLIVKQYIFTHYSKSIMNLGRRKEEIPGPEGIHVSASHSCPTLATASISECPCSGSHGSLIATAAGCRHDQLKEVNQAPKDILQVGPNT